MAGDLPWQRGAGQRSRGTRPRRRMLIVCEDEKSSRYYFESFPVDPARAEVIAVGTGMNTESLVEHALALAARSARSDSPYGDVWCVFDRDSFPDANYSRAFELARANRLHVAWSNEAFELWYLLHFNYHDTGIPRSRYAEKLEPYFRYDKADRTVYERLKERQPVALKNAHRLERHWAELGKFRPEASNPSTRVHHLVEFLNDLSELGPT